ncbi:MAG: glycosyltransferase family 2 protein [Clostridia bacterium]|nr:glycosyltransferase family 2 protein [Clostridia bacterium]
MDEQKNVREDGKDLYLKELREAGDDIEEVIAKAVNLSSSRGMRVARFLHRLRGRGKTQNDPMYEDIIEPLKRRAEKIARATGGDVDQTREIKYEPLVSVPECRCLDEKYTKFDVISLCGETESSVKEALGIFTEKGHRVYSFGVAESRESLESRLIREGVRDALVIGDGASENAEYLKDKYGFSIVSESDVKARGAENFVAECRNLFPKVSVIVLCYNQLEYTKQCVKSVLENTAYPNYELVLVDNASTDGTAEWLGTLSGDDRIKTVVNRENRGFAGGNNDGIKASDGDYFVLLNNDTLVTRGWLTGLVKWVSRKDDRVGLAGPVTNSIGNEAMINLGYFKKVRKMPRLAYGYTAKNMGNEYPHNGILAMFCVIFSRELTEKIGLLDEGYGVGMFEDDDYSTSAKKAGYRLVMAEDVFVHHYGSVSFKKLEDEKYKALFEKNKGYYEKKWNSGWKMPHYRPGVRPEI